MNIELNVSAIKKLMAEKRMTTIQLAKLSGLVPNSISKILHRGTCSIISAGCIAAALDVDVEEIWKEE